jgi:hypothetical protein
MQHVKDINMHLNAFSRAPDESRVAVEPDDEKLIFQMALHAADVLHPAKAMPYNSGWAERIRQEFFVQEDREWELGLTMSAGYPMEKMQAGFIIRIVRPLFALCQFPNAQFSHCMKQLHENLLHWQIQL